MQTFFNLMIDTVPSVQAIHKKEDNKTYIYFTTKMMIPWIYDGHLSCRSRQVMKRDNLAVSPYNQTLTSEMHNNDIAQIVLKIKLQNNYLTSTKV